jgi:hypothetical protein
MKQVVLILILIHLVAVSGFSNNPVLKNLVVSGVVKDAQSGETLSGVKVQIQGTDLTTYSDKEGNFTFTQIPSENISLCFQLVSFQSEVLNIPDVQKTSGSLEVIMAER